MNASNLEIMTRGSAIYAIDAYRKYISPRKGFSCPHRLLYDGQSCSEYIKDLFLHQDLTRAIAMTRQRFERCTQASHQLQKSSSGCIVIPCCVPI